MGTPPPLAADPTRRSSTLTALPVVVDDAHRAGLHAAAHVHGAGAVVDAVKAAPAKCRRACRPGPNDPAGDRLRRDESACPAAGRLRAQPEAMCLTTIGAVADV
jgi:hypothetical protein